MTRIDFKTGTFYLGDCFDVMATLAPGSVDMVLNDPPYGTTQNKWDSVLPLPEMWRAYWGLLKHAAPAIISAQAPFDKILGASQIDLLKYEWIWQKTNATGHLNARKQPMKEHENILVFCRGQHLYNAQDLQPYNKVTKRNPYGSANYGAFAAENFQEWTNWPKSILKFGYDAAKVHPTQKPVALFEYLIRTYTNPSELVLDNTAGSGTTAIAAIQSGRRWICIERDPDYFQKAVARVQAAEDLLPVAVGAFA